MNNKKMMGIIRLDKYTKAVLALIALCIGPGVHAGKFEVAKGRYCSELEKDAAVVGSAWIDKQDFEFFTDYFATVKDEAEAQKLMIQGEQIYKGLKESELKVKERGFSTMTVEEYESMLERLLSKWADICK